MHHQSYPNEYQKPSAPPVYSQTGPPTTGIPVRNSAGNFQPGHQRQPEGLKSWNSGLFDCFSDCSNCCITCWCPCITFGQISEIVDEGRSSCAINGAIYALLNYLIGCGCLFSCFYRSKMRQTYRLNGGRCGDCLLHCFCEPCALCQEYRELKHQGFDMSIGWHKNLERQNTGVAMAPNVEGGMRR